MKISKFAGVIAAAAIAFSGICSIAPVNADALNGAAVVSGSEYTDKKGFVMAKDKQGDLFVSDYTGSGGDITIPSDAVYIGDGAFSGKKSVTSVTIPSTCYGGIGASAFAGCVNLKKVDVKGDIECVGEKAFFACIKLKTVTFRGSVAESKVYGSYYGGGIFDKAFYCCKSLKTVKFTKYSSTLSCIGSGAFANCLSLTDVTLPHKVSTIYDAFYNCPKLVAVSVPWQATVDRYAFGYILDQSVDEDEAEYQRATGTVSAKVRYYTYDSENNSLVKHYKKITPSKFTLVVEQGTDAEKYAKSNHIIYRYRLSAPESVLASRGKNKITLSWNWVNGADYYIVYLQNNLTGKYEEYDRVTSETCTITGLRSDTKYNFRLVAVDTIDGTDIAGFTSELFEFHTR